MKIAQKYSVGWWGVAMCCLALQIGCALALHADHRNNLVLLPPPSPFSMQLSLLGDRQLAFRLAAARLQNAGDTFGQLTRLRDYEMPIIVAWLSLLDRLDAHSQAAPTMAGLYFGRHPNKEAIASIVNYLERHAMRDPARKWWWLVQASYMANTKLKDTGRALELAHKAAAVEAEVPIWVRQLPAFIHEQRGEKEHALQLIEAILAEAASLKTEEIAYMRYFIEERLEALPTSEHKVQAQEQDDDRLPEGQ